MRRALIISLALVGLTLAVYWPVQGFDFIDYDDTVYVSNNPMIARGFTKAGLHYAFTGEVLGYWQPLTLISHMLDCQLFGLNAGMHHVINLGFHLLNMLLIFYLLRRMTGAEWRSAAVAALFALHPLHVESVAWIAERKDVLSTFFWCLTVWGYLNWVERRKFVIYVLTLVAFTLGLLAKSMLVTLPCVLVLLDFWPLNRFKLPAGEISWRGWLRGLKPLVVEKIPFFLLATVLSVVTYEAQKSQSLIAFNAVPLSARVANAFVSYARYLENTFWPQQLTAFYPHPVSWPGGLVAASLAVFAGASWLAVAQVRVRPYITIGWLWFVGVLFPTIGLLQTGWQARADHFTYVPLIGVFLAVVWAACDLTRGWNRRAEILIFCGTLVLAACAFASHVQLRYWRNSYEVYARMAACNPNNPVAEFGLGGVALHAGQYEEAVVHYQRATQLYPDYAEAYVNLGNSLSALNRPEESEAAYTQAVTRAPRNLEALLGLANRLQGRGDFSRALELYQRAIEVNPDVWAVHYNYAIALESSGRAEEARRELERGLELQPNLVDMHYALANLLARHGIRDAAKVHLAMAIRIDSRRAELHAALGSLFLQEGYVDQAAAEFEQWVRLVPNDALGLYRLGIARMRQYRFADAVKILRQSVQLDGDQPDRLATLARVLASSSKDELRNGEEAVRLAEHALSLAGGKDFIVLDTLAAAYAEKGRFADAVTAEQKGLEQARAGSHPEVLQEMEARLALYQNNKPFRQGP